MKFDFWKSAVCSTHEVFKSRRISFSPRVSRASTYDSTVAWGAGFVKHFRHFSKGSSALTSLALFLACEQCKGRFCLPDVSDHDTPLRCTRESQSIYSREISYERHLCWISRSLNTFRSEVFCVFLDSSLTKPSTADPFWRTNYLLQGTSRAMEFMAVEKGMGFKGETSIKRELIDLNITTNLDSECWKPASQQHPPKEKRGHYLSRVKPQMMQQVLSFKGSFDERKACISSHGHVKGSGVGETMELFPQHTRFATAKPINANTCFSPASVHHRHLAGQGPSGVGGARPTSARSVPPATTALKQSSTELTVFYNGTVNVYGVPADKAEAILNLLAGNGNSHQSNPDPNFDERAVCSTPSGSSNIPRISKAKSIGAPNGVPATLPIPKQTAIADSINEIIKLQKEAAELPLARKQSLQRFLEKRQTRLNGVAPYPTSGSLPKKAVEDKMRAPLLLSSEMECGAIPL